jgi:hypothetical protein
MLMRALAVLAIWSSSALTQQVVDTTFSPHLRARPTFAAGRGPIVLIDEAHNNFHTMGARYRPFAHLLAADGFAVQASRSRFDSASLAAGRVLVIANAVGARNKEPAAWRLPVLSAFDQSEIAAVAGWVRRGGALLLIADHLPFAGAADSLAGALGVFFANGFAIPPYDADPRTGDYPIVFRRGDGALATNAITNGRSAAERIDSVVSFTGSGFRLIETETRGALLRLPSGTRVRLPVRAWQFSDSTPEIRGDGLLQGAALHVGRGRVAVFGEAAMFSAQIKGAERVAMGMNAPAAAQNAQFALNVMHWLVGLLPDR